ncbi:hypothetical protein [Bacillus suaedaesalsae]|uniref:Uncharacterized protein n=1 Tax=Bacillus suaedaesalsae TaxID=2810349 RepID=A0ABS2DMS8_9BACI|nr:hypothetical protein [Bacillus suaedaesalsae]MBM6619807.1 hypothetical protein [Bacillus suaedaesalsae]
MSVIRNYQQFGFSVNTIREYPDVDSTKFSESATTFRGLMKDASKVLDRLADSKAFAHDVMSAAQLSNTIKVEQLIESTGLNSKVTPTFNPDGLTMVFHDQVEETDCCKLTMTLRW